MNFNIFGQISKIVSRQINNIAKNITRIIKVTAKPFVYLNTYVRAQVKAMLRPPSGKADYVRFGGIYLSKRFLGLSVMGIAITATVFSTVVYPWLEGRLWTPTILLNSQKLAGYTGPARIKNDSGMVIYVGDVASGQLTGFATQYDTEGNLVYTGEFVNAAYSGYGSLYVDGVLRYEGDFSENLYNGEGRLYNENGILIYQGGFAQGQRSGRGMEYRPDTRTLVYSGDFAGDTWEGSGVVYEEDGVTVRYRGELAAGLYEGEGSYYENGVLRYQGQFSKGLFEGTGALYDDAGNLVYQGEFSQGNRQGVGTTYDAIGSALYTGEFLDNNVNFIGYLGVAPADIAAAFGSPGYTALAGESQILAYLNLGAAFLCEDDGNGLVTCRRVLVDVDQNFLGISRDTTEEELALLLGQRFSTLTLSLATELSEAARQLSLELPSSGRVDKYLMSTYYIKLYYDADGTRIAAIECGGY